MVRRRSFAVRAASFLSASSLPFEVPPLLAVGGHLKSAFTLARGRHAYQSQHLGDLESVASLDFFEESLHHLMHTFEIEPEFVVRDMHPGYVSSTWANRWAAERKLPVIEVQHHHAHIAACMAEHGLEGPVIGLSLDGTGYGTDGKVWGGEVLIVCLGGRSPGSFDRFAHLDYVPMPGAEAAIREPWRMALGHLHAAGFDLDDPFIAKALGTNAKETALLQRMIARGLNTPLTSSCGRLFDAVAALVLRRREVDYEAQAAIELEGICIDEPNEIAGYSFEFVPAAPAGPTKMSAPGLASEIEESNRPSRPGTGHNFSRDENEPKDEGALVPEGIRCARMWHELLADLRTGQPPARIAARFHAGIANAFVHAAKQARTGTGIRQVVLSGGCLHNRRLARLLRAALQEEGFVVFQHRQVSPGDGGLSYGQAVVAAAIIKHRREQGPSGP